MVWNCGFGAGTGFMSGWMFFAWIFWAALIGFIFGIAFWLAKKFVAKMK